VDTPAHGSFQHVQDWTFRQVNDLARATGWLHTPARMWAEYGVVLFAVLLLLGWWRARSIGEPARVAAALWAPFGMLLAIGINQPVGHLVAERRPYDVLQHVLVLVPRTTDFSFPSDHAVMAGAVAAGVWWVDRRLGMIALLAAVAMAFARVYVGAHYPLDVVAGLTLGAVVTTAGLLAVRPILLRLVLALERTRLRPLLSVT
jgi:membrane-associated phospholipid phosphatase